MREDLFKYGKHIEQSEIYSAADIIGVSDSDLQASAMTSLGDTSTNETEFSSIHDFDYCSIDYDATNLWKDEPHFREI